MGRLINKGKNIAQKVIIVLFWLCIWQLVAVRIHNNILLVGPIQAGKALVANVMKTDFWKIVLCSFERIGLGFVAAFFVGIILGTLAYKSAFIEALLAPVMSTVKSIPVASFTVLLLIWFGSPRLSFFISLLVVLPNVYVNTIAGLQSTQKELLEMAKVFHIGGLNRFLFIYRPALMPYLISCLKVSLGMSWKSGVAAEVIGMPQYSLGERLYMSKIYLDTAGLFSWTFVVILLSFVFEKTVIYLVKNFAAWKPVPVSGSAHFGDMGHAISKNGMALDDSVRCCKNAEDIRINNVSKAYGGHRVIDDFSYIIERGKKYCLTAPSGGGKTTLLKLINHIEQPDSGNIEGVPERVGMVFQEDRLCEEYDTITNIMLTARPWMDKQAVYKEALQILPEDCLDKPVSALSGGMKRRCAVLRAMLSGADIIIMDEPFTGLDEENRERTASYILERLSGRTLIITTHRDEDVGFFEGIRIELLT